jgi:predicted DNA-binding transcriptional regulator AlpA
MTTLIDVKTIATTLGVNPRVVNERILKHPDFPRPALAINHKMRRWDKGQFDAWLARQAKRMAR